MPMTDNPQLSIAEAVKLGAVNNEIYCRTFFPRTFRQASPPFQRDLWQTLDDPAVRCVNEQIFRGGAKTTLSRTFASKRIAYGVSKTILYIGASEGAAARSGKWIRRQVERNKLWSGTFSLVPGVPWTDTEFVIEHNTLGESIYVLCAGITGNVRGINFDDWRPDLIILDDILTDENCATKEQRDKINNLVHGALAKSLAPVVDEPNAKICMLVTPQHKEDASHLVENSEIWRTIKVGCWTPETALKNVDEQISIWPERLPTAQLRAEKRDAARLNQLSTFSREMEVRLTSRETADFRSEWLNYYAVAPKGMTTILSIDPSPPPSDSQLARGLIGKDPEVIHVWGRHGQDYYLLESRSAVGETPDWTITNAFELALKYRPVSWVVETVAYQRTLKWLLEKEMRKRRIYWQIVPFVGGNKYAGIRAAFSGLASHGHIHVRAEHTEFVSQFETFPSCDHDDELDAGRVAVGALYNPFAAVGGDEATSAEVEEINVVRGAP
jgi:predicted phage terminase large subunit-like protein